MKRFMFLSIGVLCLAVAALIGFYIGSHQVIAQTPPQAMGFCATTYGAYCFYMILPNGDTYSREICEVYPNVYCATKPVNYMGNYWEGATATNKSTWGGVKQDFKK
jgi:hypothetical protein